MPGYFYPPPPTFIGGRQPYAPPLGQVQSAPTPSAPPIKTYVTFGILLASWIPQQVPVQPRARIAPNITIELAVAPPPLSNQRLTSVLAHWYQEPTTIVELCSVASLLPAPAAPDNPPARSWVNHDTILRQWVPKPYAIPVSPGIGSQTAAPAAPDMAPSVTAARLNLLTASWLPKPWWPLPAGGKSAPPSAAVPDNPPPSTRTRFQAAFDQWYTPHRPLPSIKPIAAWKPPGDALLEIVPYLIGAEELSARFMLTQIYLVPVVIGSTGSVVSQSIAHMSIVPRGTQVTITMGGAINVPPKTGQGGLPPYTLPMA